MQIPQSRSCKFWNLVVNDQIYVAIKSAPLAAVLAAAFPTKTFSKNVNNGEMDGNYAKSNFK